MNLLGGYYKGWYVQSTLPQIKGGLPSTATIYSSE